MEFYSGNKLNYLTPFHKWPLLLILLIFSTGSLCYSQQTRNVSPAGTRYFLYTPPGYSPGSGPYPLLVSLHGQVGIGDNLDEILESRDQSPARLIDHGQWPEEYPFIVLSPQLKRDHSQDPEDQDWDPALVDEVIEHVRSAYAVDGNRIYLVGLSLGASGVWLYGAAYPQKVAAMIPISGVPDSTQGCFVKNIPAWVFHGENDGLIEPVFATGMVNAINNCQPPGDFSAHLTLMRARKHDGWSEVYNNSNAYRIYDWLLKFEKNDDTNKTPYVNAGNDIKVVRRDQPLHLYGEYFDSDGMVSHVNWSQTEGPALTLEGTDSHFLKLSNLVPGIFEFKLQVTDELGGQASDQVRVEIAESAGSLPEVSDLILLDTEGEVISKLKEGYVINPNILGTRKINIRADASGNALSVRFRINNDHNTRTTNTPGPYLIASREWILADGDYLVCATPFDGRVARGNAGVSQCYKVIVSTTAESPPDEEEPDDPEGDEPDPPVDDPNEGEDPPPGDDGPGEDPEEPPTDEDPPGETPQLPTNFFAIAGQDISVLAGWTSNIDGSGDAPTSFSLDRQQFEITDSVLLLNPLTVSGTGSTLVIREGGTLVVKSALSSPVNIEANATLYIDTSAEVELGNIDPESTIVFEQATNTIPGAQFGVVHLRGYGTIKNLSAGQTKIHGDLIINDGVILAGTSDLSSTLAISGDVYIHSENSFEPQPRFSLLFEKAGAQTIHSRAPEIFLNQITVSPVTEVVLASTSSNLKLGSTEGGGLAIASGGKFFIGTNTLSITGAGSINPDDEGGEIAFKNSVIRIESTSLHNSHLNAELHSDSVSTLMVNLQGAGQLHLDNPLFITDQLSLINGSIHSNGNIVLVSDSARTAMVAPNDGTIFGDVHFQRFLSKGFKTRYVTFPLGGAGLNTVRLLVSANADTTVSLSVYEDAIQDFVPLSSPGNTGLAFAKGYAIQLPDTVSDYLLTASGIINSNHDVDPLTPNPEADPYRGWNLLGNPFCSPIAWRQDYVTSAGVSAVIQILDHRSPFERYLVWDGETGDEEFASLVAQGQGFFIQTLDANPTLSLKPEAARDTSMNMRTGVTTEQLKITLRQNNIVDRAYLKFATAGNDSLDIRDGVKRKNGHFSFSTLSADSVALAINSLNEITCEKKIGLQLDDLFPGKYSLDFSGRELSGDWQITLIDTELDSVLSIKDGSMYIFEIGSEKGTHTSRFFLWIRTSAVPEPVITMDGSELVSNYEAGNQWMLNGEPVPDANGQIYEPLVSGEYSLVVSNNGCVSESQRLMFSVTGLNESAAINIYPNPADKSVQVELSRQFIGTEIQIVNAVGVSMMNAIIQSHEFDIDLDRFTPGVYIVTISGRHQVHQVKLVVR